MSEYIQNESNELLAIIDIGSNSVRMNIYEIDWETKDFSVVFSNRAMLKLASYKNDGILSADGEGKLFSVLRDFQAKANSYPTDKLIAFATASLRGIKNSDKILSRMKNRLGIDIDIITGEREAELDYIATKKEFEGNISDKGVVIDMGGGSTEIIAFENGSVTKMVSLPIGAVALWKTYVSNNSNSPFPNEEQRKQIEDYVLETLKQNRDLYNFGGTAYLIGGTARTLSKLDMEILGTQASSSGYSLSKNRFTIIRNAVFDDSKVDGVLIRKIANDRLTSIVPGVLSYKVIIKYLGVKEAIVSLAGVREGFMVEYTNNYKNSSNKGDLYYEL